MTGVSLQFQLFYYILHTAVDSVDLSILAGLNSGEEYAHLSYYPSPVYSSMI